MRDVFWPVFATSFAVVFLAEFGDLTQFLTISLAARFHDPASVGVGGHAGAVGGGRCRHGGWRFVKLIPMEWLTRGAAVVMLALAGTSAYAAAGCGVVCRDRPGHGPFDLPELFFFHQMSIRGRVGRCGSG